MKKIIAFLIMTALLLTLSGCNNKTPTTSKAPSKNNSAQKVEYDKSMTVLYSKADSFNPYTANTDVNRQLCKLLYEPLVKTDDNFKSHNAIAKSVKISKDICTVELKDVKFSDGTRLTADDVVYSYKLAKKSKTSYKNKLYEVESVNAKDSNTVVFTLKKQDRYFANVLDFPIIKLGSDKKADSDSVKFPPIGAGRYKLNKDNNALLLNEHYFAKKSSIKKINLINSPDMESITHYIEIGATDIYFSDISNGEIPRMSGTKTNINLNNLVYIGVNHANKKLAIVNLRQAISSGIDRSEIIKNAYFNNALSCTGFFNPLWEETKSLQNIQITANSQISVENLEEIGYNRLDSDGVRRNGNSPLSFSLLVNKENSARVATAKLIAKQLKKQGIKITVVKVSFKEYKRRLKKGEFDLYLGEVKITENMDFTELATPGGSAAYGIKAQKKKDTEKEEQDNKKENKEESKTLDCSKVIKNFYKGKNSISDVAVTLQNDMPFIPVCYRTGVLFANENIENLKIASLSDIYFSIDSYKIKKN